MHILHCCFDKKHGGTDQSFIQYCRAMIQLGHRVTAVVHPKFRFKQSLESLDIQYYQLGLLFNVDPIATYRIKMIAKDVNPDLCLVHNNRTARIVITAKLGIPLAGIAYDNNSESLSKIDKLIVPNELLKQNFINLGHDESKINVIPIPIIPPNIFNFTWHKTPVIGCFVEENNVKNVDSLLLALSKLKSKEVSFNCVLSSNDKIPKALIEKVIRYKLTDLVEYKEKLVYRDVFFEKIDLLYYASSSPVLSLPSEAMANGKVVVAADTSGIKEIITNANNGIIFPFGNVDRLAHQLETLLSSESNARFLAENAFKITSEQYKLESITSKLSQLLESFSYAEAA